jgi:hypothetical protein
MVQQINILKFFKKLIYKSLLYFYNLFSIYIYIYLFINKTLSSKVHFIQSRSSF